MKKGKKQKTVQVELYYGLVPATVYERRLEELNERFIASETPADARSALQNALEAEAAELMDLFYKDPATRTLLFPNQESNLSAGAVVPWIALNMETDDLIFKLKRIGGDIQTPCLPSDLMHLVENQVDAGYDALHQLILRRQQNLAKERPGLRMWKFSRDIVPFGLHRVA